MPLPLISKLLEQQQQQQQKLFQSKTVHIFKLHGFTYVFPLSLLSVWFDKKNVPPIFIFSVLFCVHGKTEQKSGFLTLSSLQLIEWTTHNQVFSIFLFKILEHVRWMRKLQSANNKRNRKRGKRGRKNWMNQINGGWKKIKGSWEHESNASYWAWHSLYIILCVLHIVCIYIFGCSLK